MCFLSFHLLISFWFFFLFNGVCHKQFFSFLSFFFFFPVGFVQSFLFVSLFYLNLRLGVELWERRDQQTPADGNQTHSWHTQPTFLTAFLPVRCRLLPLCCWLPRDGAILTRVMMISWSEWAARESCAPPHFISMTIFPNRLGSYEKLSLKKYTFICCWSSVCSMFILPGWIIKGLPGNYAVHTAARGRRCVQSILTTRWGTRTYLHRAVVALPRGISALFSLQESLSMSLLLPSPSLLCPRWPHCPLSITSEAKSRRHCCPMVPPIPHGMTCPLHRSYPQIQAPHTQSVRHTLVKSSSSSSRRDYPLGSF